MPVNVITVVLFACALGLLLMSMYLALWVQRLRELLVKRERELRSDVRACEEKLHQQARDSEEERELWQKDQRLIESAWVAERQDVEARNTQLQKANAEFARDQEDYIAALESERDVARRLRDDLAKLGQDMVHIRRHTVLLDGISGAGKTTLLERLTNPAATSAHLAKVAATATAQLTEPVPLCWEVVDGRRVLHTLEFYDVGGENPGQVVDNITEFLERQRDPEAEGQAIVLVIWNSEAELNTDPSLWNTEALNPSRLAATYATRSAKTAISSFVFFMNKVDRVRERLRAEQREHEFDAFLEHQRQRLEAEVWRKALSHYAAPELAVGSAVDGSGVHDCLGAILRKLGLNHIYSSRIR